MIRASFCIALLLLAHSAAHAQWPGMRPIDTPSDPAAIPLGTTGWIESFMTG